MNCLCRDCALLFKAATAAPCPSCRSTRTIFHEELTKLSIAHIDCDAFYASVEKRDNPDIQAKPVIIGGGQRGVVSAACYIARISGVRSAMPMFQARKLCPDAVVIPPNMAKYSAAGKQIRSMMETLTPLVEPLSIDEAFLDLSGTRALHGMSPAETLARFVKRVEDEVGISASVGLSHNKFLAKIASDLDKPRGFAIIGEAESLDFLADKSVSLIWGVGKVMRAKLEKDGIRKIGELRRFSEKDLMQRYGSMGQHLYYLCRAQDRRIIDPESSTKSISNETTFNKDISDFGELSSALWQLSDKVSSRLKEANFGGTTITLKLKTGDFKTVTRSRQLQTPTQLNEDIFTMANDLLKIEANGRAFRLIGVGASKLVDAQEADLPDLADPDREKRVKVENAIDSLREKFGTEMIGKGRGFKPTTKPK